MGPKIRVVPNTSGFDKEVKADLEKIERGLVIKIPVEIDGAKAKADLERLTKTLGRQKVKVDVETDTGRATSGLGRFVRKAGELAAKVKVELDTRDLRDQRAKVAAEIEKLGGGRSSVKIDADISALEKKRKSIERDLATLGESEVTVGIDADIKAAEKKRDQIETKLEKLEKIEVSPKVELDIKAAELRRKQITDRLDDLSKKKVTPKVEADIAKAKIDLEKVDLQLKELSDKKANVKVEADITAAKAEIEKITADLADLENQKANVEVDADVAAAEAELANIAAQIDELEGKKATPEVDADIAKAEAELEKIDKQLAELDKKNADITVDADTAKALAQAEAARKEIDGKKATIKVDVDKKGLGVLSGDGGGGGGLLGGALSGLQGLASGASGALGTLGNIATTAASSLVTLSIAAAGVLVIAGGVTFAVGAMGAAIGLLPAALFGLGGAAGAVALGLDGIKAAAQTAAPALAALKASVSEVFASSQNFGSLFSELAKTVLPGVTTGFGLVAQGVSNVAFQMAAAVFDPPGLANLQQTLVNVKLFLDTTAISVGGLIRVILEIGTKVGIFQTLGDIVAYLTLMVSGLLSRLAEGPPGFSLMEQAGRALLGVIMALGDLITELIVGATQFFTAAAPGVSDALGAIRDVIADMVNSGVFKTLGEAFGTFAGYVADFIRAIPPETWQNMATAVGQAVEAFGRLANNPAVQQFFSALIVVIPQVIGFLIDLVSTVFTVGGQIIAVFLQLGAGAASVLESFGLLAPGTAQKLQDMAGAVRGATPEIAGAGDALGAAGAQGIANGIAPAPGQVGAVTGDAIDRVKGGRGNMLGAGNQLGAAGADGAKTGVAPLPGNIGGAVVDGRNRAAGEEGGYRGVGTNLASGLAVGVSSGQSGLIAAAIGIANAAWQAAKNFLGIASPSKLFRDDVGAWVGPGMAIGIESGTKGVEASSARLGVAAIQGAQRGMARVSPELQSAARELLARVNSGGQIFEDLTFRGMSANLGKYNEQLMDMLDDSNKSLRDFLSGIVSQQAAANQAGQTIGQQVAAGVNSGMATSLDQYRPAGGQDFFADAVKSSRIATIWSGGGDPGERASGGGMPAADMQWTVELDPEGLARITAKGNRSLERR